MSTILPKCTGQAPSPTPGRTLWSYLKTAGTRVARLLSGNLAASQNLTGGPGPSPSSRAETAVKAIYASLTAEQKKAICFDWNYHDKKRGLLRTFIANHWQITRPVIRSDFFTRKQQWLIHDIFKGIINPSWYRRFLRQLKDDTFGHEWGQDQSIAIFGGPGTSQFQFVITGRHITLRADGNMEGRVAFGGPILYGHATSTADEKIHHPGNIFWPQAQLAGKVYRLLDKKQQQRSQVAQRPPEERVDFRGTGGQFPGIRVAELDDGQKKQLREVLLALVEPFRKEDQQWALACLHAQGGLDRCSLAFYQEGNIGGEGEWDNWRLEGPAFVWYFRGTPHVHVWVNVANDPTIPLNAHNGVFLHPNHDLLGAPVYTFVDS
jgi:hypothetical protein